MEALTVILCLQAAVPACGFTDNVDDEEPYQLDYSGETKGRGKRHVSLPPADYALVRVTPEVAPHLDMYNETHANMSQDLYLFLSRGPKHLPTRVVLPITAIYIVIFLCGVMGNTLVSIVVVKNSTMHSATNFYLFSLAISDLMLLLLGLPNDLSVYWQQYPWVFGEAVCRIRALASEMSSYCSVLTIVAFSMERYFAVCKPLQSYQISTLSRASKIIALIWVVSLLFALPFAIYTDVNYVDFPPDSGRLVEESAFCAMLLGNIPSVPIYEISTVLFFVIPLIALTYIYWEILKKLRIREYSFNGQGLGMGQAQEARRLQSRKAIIRMLGAVVICFFLCWAPFHFQRLYYIHMADSPNFQIINEWLYYVTGCFYYFSSTVNPILYTLMSTKYRHAFKDALFCRSKNRRRRPVVSVKRSTERSSSIRATSDQRDSERISPDVSISDGSFRHRQAVTQVTDRNGNMTTSLASPDHGFKTFINSPSDGGNDSLEGEKKKIDLPDIKKASKETYI